MIPRITIIAQEYMLLKVWAFMPPICDCLNSPYYKDDVAENWELLPPKWKNSIFSILQSRRCRKFGNISQQNIGSIHSPTNNDTAENLGTHAPKK